MVRYGDGDQGDPEPNSGACKPDHRPIFPGSSRCSPFRRSQTEFDRTVAVQACGLREWSDLLLNLIGLISPFMRLLPCFSS